jgi:hypothetical protein
MSAAHDELRGRILFFATKDDLTPGLRAVERLAPAEYVLDEMRDDPTFTTVHTLSDAPHRSETEGRDVNTSPRYLVFAPGRAPRPRGVPQQRGGTKYVIDPTPDCLILKCGGLHVATGALFAGELQEPLGASSRARALFELYAQALFHGFARVKEYSVGPGALRGLRSGLRLITISLKSPREFDLAES